MELKEAIGKQVQILLDKKFEQIDKVEKFQ